jgi:hypothetical protein
MSGKVFVDIKVPWNKLLFIELTIPKTVSLFEVSDNITFDCCHFYGNQQTIIKNINVTVGIPELDFITLNGFGEVVDCGNKGSTPGAIHVIDCGRVINSTFTYAKNC